MSLKEILNVSLEMAKVIVGSVCSKLFMRTQWQPEALGRLDILTGGLGFHK